MLVSLACINKVTDFFLKILEFIVTSGSLHMSKTMTHTQLSARFRVVCLII